MQPDTAEQRTMKTTVSEHFRHIVVILRTKRKEIGEGIFREALGDRTTVVPREAARGAGRGGWRTQPRLKEAGANGGRIVGRSSTLVKNRSTQEIGHFAT